MKTKPKVNPIDKKASDLMRRFTFIGMGEREAKQCAIISIDNVLDYLGEDGYPQEIEFWRSVRQKLERNVIQNPLTDEQKAKISDLINENIGKRGIIHTGKERREALTIFDPDHLRMVNLGWIVRADLLK